MSDEGIYLSIWRVSTVIISKYLKSQSVTVAYDTAVRNLDRSFFPHSVLSLFRTVNGKSILINIWLPGQQWQ